MSMKKILQDHIYEFLAKIGYRYDNDQLAERLKEVFGSAAANRALLKIATENYMTSRELQDVGVPESTAHRAIRRLKEIKMIEQNTKLNQKRIGGPEITQYRRVVSQRWFPTLYRDPNGNAKYPFLNLETEPVRMTVISLELETEEEEEVDAPDNEE
jgi:hypothetical protein